MADNYEKFHIGTNVFVVRDGKLLLGKRKNVYGASTWGLPGGHLETGEAMKDSAARELMEETGLSAKIFEFANIVNDRSRNEHYIQVGFVAKEISGEPVLREPDRCEEWRWFGLGELPEVFPAHARQIKNFIEGIGFADD